MRKLTGEADALFSRPTNNLQFGMAPLFSRAVYNYGKLLSWRKIQFLGKYQSEGLFMKQ